MWRPSGALVVIDSGFLNFKIRLFSIGKYQYLNNGRFYWWHGAMINAPIWIVIFIYNIKCLTLNNTHIYMKRSRPNDTLPYLALRLRFVQGRNNNVIFKRSTIVWKALGHDDKQYNNHITRVYCREVTVNL